jgi:hypothetical protein
VSVVRRRKRPLRDQLTAEDRYVKIDPAPIDRRTPFEEGEFPIIFLARSTDAEAGVLTAMLMHADVPSMIIDFEVLASADFELNIPGRDVRFKGGQLRPFGCGSRTLHAMLQSPKLYWTCSTRGDLEHCSASDGLLLLDAAPDCP